ncbi:hypothetical protein GCM10009654_67640 [Streptomyces hebeiensis]|uniref:Uncharacterized protein n=1 Tax=Streptomyces hebeiensis TaxID=229486 RepID=A0ABP4FX80_9ACTN
MNPSPNALSAFPAWIRRMAARVAVPVVLVTLTCLDSLKMKTSKIKFEAQQYTFKDFNAT